MTTEDQRTGDFALRMAFALQKEPAEAERRTRVTLLIVTVTLAWLVLVPLLVVYGLTGPRRGGEVFSVAAMLNVLLPFVAAVIATRARRFPLGGVYVVLTLVMVLPALAIIRAG
ncbi:hypothetical protein ACWKSP_12930 [Micromonosporaceae bacterium Da 78-11]